MKLIIKYKNVKVTERQSEELVKLISLTLTKNSNLLSDDNPLKTTNPLIITQYEEAD